MPFRLLGRVSVPVNLAMPLGVIGRRAAQCRTVLRVVRQGRRQIVHKHPARHEPLLLGRRQTQKHFRSRPHALQIVLALVDIRRGGTALEQAIVASQAVRVEYSNVNAMSRSSSTY